MADFVAYMTVAICVALVLSIVILAARLWGGETTPIKPSCVEAELPFPTPAMKRFHVWGRIPPQEAMDFPGVPELGSRHSDEHRNWTVAERRMTPHGSDCYRIEVLYRPVRTADENENPVHANPFV